MKSNPSEEELLMAATTRLNYTFIVDDIEVEVRKTVEGRHPCSQCEMFCKAVDDCAWRESCLANKRKDKQSVFYKKV